MDATDALAVEGVHAYVCADDVSGDNMIGVIKHDEELFATKQVDTYRKILLKYNIICIGGKLYCF